MSSLSSAVNTLVSEYEKIDGGIAGYTAAVSQIVAQYANLTNGSAELVKGSGALVSGSGSLYSGTGELLSGIVEIYNGAGSLKDGTGQLSDGVAELLVGILQLRDGSGALKDGTSALREETDGMDSKINDQIDELLESVTGGDVKPTSFVSEKNTEVSSVQFVLQTESIHIEEPEEPVQEEKKLTFWEGLLDLFGLYQEK